MSHSIISIEQLSKVYPLRTASPEPYQTLRESIVRAAKNPFGNKRAGVEDFWALRDVSFEIKPGDRIGVIGRNGAGKSTLLKILSRITEPSSGRITLRGRVASLLEVGTGFHPELTGRENIYLNGAILGMSRAEIRAKFDEIVAFAEVEAFLETPVKRYSSGMYVRLAFAVAAHLEPDVLIVDEVLAVGDVGFQQKCLRKMNEVSATGGRTVVFVTHDMSVLLALCDRCILLERGRMMADGPARDVVAQYLHPSSDSSGLLAELNSNQTEVHVENVCVVQNGEARQLVRAADDFSLRLAIRVLRPLEPFRVFLALVNDAGQTLFTTSDCDITNAYCNYERGPSALSWSISVPGNLLRPGNYHIAFGVDIRKMRVVVEHDSILRFEVYDDRDSSLSERYVRPGALGLLLEWRRS